MVKTKYFNNYTEMNHILARMQHFVIPRCRSSWCQAMTGHSCSHFLDSVSGADPEFSLGGGGGGSCARKHITSAEQARSQGGGGGGRPPPNSKKREGRGERDKKGK